LLQHDEENSDDVNSIVDVIDNAFQVIRSLIHLGSLWQNSHDFSDWEYISNRAPSSNGNDSSLKAGDEKVDELSFQQPSRVGNTIRLTGRTIKVLT